MAKDDNLNLDKVKSRRDELETILTWKMIPRLNHEEKYKITIAYDTGSPKVERIMVLGEYSTRKIVEKILAFFDKFLTEVDCFGLLLKSQRSGEMRNMEISFFKKKEEKEENKQPK